MTRFLWLDFLRGAAAIGVLSFHVVVVTDYTQLDGLYVLVDFFFVLSGFVLWPSMPKEASAFVKDVRRFIAKRLLRLWPILGFMIAISYLVYAVERKLGYIENPDLNRSTGLALASIAMLQIIFSSAMFINVPTWSLSAEWLTNLIFAPLTIVKSNKGIVYGILSGYLCLNIGLTMDRGWIDFIGPIRGYEALGRALIGFGLGLLLRKHYSRLSKFQNKFLLVLSIYGVWWSFSSYINHGYNNTYFVGWIFAFFILQVSKYELSAEKRFGRFAKFLGSYSYGIYVFHQMAIDFLKPLIPEPDMWADDSVFRNYFIEKASAVCFVAILFTWITHRVFEGPIQRLGSKALTRSPE